MCVCVCDASTPQSMVGWVGRKTVREARRLNFRLYLWCSCRLAGPSRGAAAHYGRQRERMQPRAGGEDPLAVSPVRLPARSLQVGLAAANSFRPRTLLLCGAVTMLLALLHVPMRRQSLPLWYWVGRPAPKLLCPCSYVCSIRVIGVAQCPGNDMGVSSACRAAGCLGTPAATYRPNAVVCK